MAIAATIGAVALTAGGAIYASEKREDMMEATVARREERAKAKKAKAEKIEKNETKKRQSIIRNAISGSDDSLFDLLGGPQA